MRLRACLLIDAEFCVVIGKEEAGIWKTLEVPAKSCIFIQIEGKVQIAPTMLLKQLDYGSLFYLIDDAVDDKSFLALLELRLVIENELKVCRDCPCLCRG